MQERILHIKLMNRSGARDGQGEHGANRGRLDHRAESLTVVNVRSLVEAMKDPASLVPLQRVIRVELMLERSFAGDDVGANWARDKILGVVGNQGSKFFFHGAAPVWIDEGGVDRGGSRQQGWR
jgi:hypothetical protein